MKKNLSDYLDASRLARSLDKAHSSNLVGRSGWKDLVYEWIDENGKKFFWAFKKLTPDLEFYCRDYSVPLREAYCLFRLIDGFTFKQIYTHDGKLKSEGYENRVEFFYYLHDSVKHAYRAEGLPETDFYKIYREMIQQDED